MVAWLNTFADDASMNALMTYWLSRTPGMETEGPFTIGQLRRMHAAGTITADAQICRHGDDEWIEASYMIEATDEISAGAVMAPAQVVYVTPRKSRAGTYGCLTAVGCVVILLVALRLLDNGGSGMNDSINQASDLQLDVKRWVRTELADKDAELMGMSEPVLVKGQYYRIVRLRGKNAFAGPVVNDFVSSSSNAGSIAWMQSLKEFRRTAKYGSLGADGAAQVAGLLKIGLDP